MNLSSMLIPIQNLTVLTSIMPKEAFYHSKMREFLLPYDAVSAAKSPDEALLSFLQSTYEAAATCAQ
jgi:Family of unknown function (DUF5996)